MVTQQQTDGNEKEGAVVSTGNKAGTPWVQLIVPGGVIAFVGAYFLQAQGLSFAALLFPATIAVTLMLISIVVISANVRAGAVAQKGGVQAGTVSHYLKAGILVVLALAVPVAWSTIGVLLTLWFFVFFVTLILGERRLLLLILVPTLLAGGIVYLFERVLRIPL